MTPPQRVAVAYPLPGWDLECKNGVYTATRKTRLTAYQLQYGAMPKVSVPDAGELWIVCDAQMRLAERLATAESIAVLHERERRAAVRSRAGDGPPDPGGSSARPPETNPPRGM